MVEEKEVVVKIEKTIKFERENLYLIITILIFSAIFLIVITFLFIYLINPEILLSPPEDIASFFTNAMTSEFKSVVIREYALDEEQEEILTFVSKFWINARMIKEPEVSSYNDKIVIGLVNGFVKTRYREYLDRNDAIVIYDLNTSSLYVYSRNMEALKQTLNILENNQSLLNYSAVKINRGYIEELFVNR